MEEIIHEHNVWDGIRETLIIIKVMAQEDWNKSGWERLIKNGLCTLNDSNGNGSC